MLTNLSLSCLVAVGLSASLAAQGTTKRLYVEPADGFEVFIAAAMAKKRVDAGNGDKGSTSVQVVDQAGAVAWSYAVNKGRGEKNKQALAEAIAKHFKDEFLRPR